MERMTIFLIPNLNKARAAQVTDHAVRFLLDAGGQVLLPEKAAELLVSTNMKVIDIAISVGYENQGKFAKVFANKYMIF